MSASTHGHGTVLKHHFDNLEQQHSAERLGMWFFLVTEVLFFTGMFVAYTVYRNWYPGEFAFASSHLLWWVAAINTGLLITSSLTMTLAIRSAQLGDKAGLIRRLLLTFALGAGFMGFKAFEYATDYHEKFVPGEMFRTEYARPLAELTADDAKRKFEGRPALTRTEVESYQFKGEYEHWSQDLAKRNYGREPATEGTVSPERVQLFLCFYYIMTGIHGVHIIVGLGCILWLVFEAYRGAIPREAYSKVEVISLYWHLVDMIWLFLMPLLYLIRSGGGQ
ncbi:MAG TPA: cytochrome c oxidase subunit 3 [Urbifossiella sp.]|nr:cytochrome c oxidase subunit 3 [Urbifossiella sp.]